MSEQREPIDFPRELRCSSEALAQRQPYTSDLLGRAAAEIASLRAQLEGCKEMFAHTAERANEYVKAFQQQEGRLASARKALEPFAAVAVAVEKEHPGWAHYAFHSDWTEYQLGFEHFDKARLALTDEKR
jgi:hypothetical protein